MPKTPFAFSEWVNELIPDDDLFARAYQGISDHDRALLKTCIARLFDWYGPQKILAGDVSLRWKGGFESRQTARPVEFFVVLFDDNLMSPARLLAALVPAMASGVENILAVRVGDGAPWRKAVLTGLELAGQEFVADMTESQARRLLSELRDTGIAGSVAVLGPKAAAIQSTALKAASRIAFWRPRFSRAAAIWMEDGATFDLEALAFVHPDIIFSVFGEETVLPADNFSYEGNGFGDFLESIMDVAYAPANRAEECLGLSKVVLGPGQEGCWVWPDLHPEHFQFHCTAWTAGE